MLSRFLQTARNILPFVKPTEATERDDHSASTMVTTRRQSGVAAPAPDSDDSSQVPLELLSPESRKRRRAQKAKEAEDDDVETTPGSKRQKKLPLRGKEGDEHVESHTHFSVVIPVHEIAGVKEKGTPSKKERDSAAKVAEEVPATQLESSPEKPAARTTKKGSTPNKKSTPKKSQNVIKDTDESEGFSQESIKEATPAKPKHKRFGQDDGSFHVVIPVEETILPTVADSEEESSDDDAPEVVGTQAAQDKALEVVREATKAAEKQEALARKKRKEKDEKLKAQAAAVGKKRKHDINQNYTSEDTSATEKRISKANLPDLLPAEFLEDDNSVDLESISQSDAVPRRKKTKFTDNSDKAPKDRKKGSTTYRVSKVSSGDHLAPKADANARSVKEAWLRGRTSAARGGGGGANRKDTKKGFFVNKK